MPFEVQWEPRGAYKRFHGFVSGDDILEAIKEITADSRFDELRYVINDFLGVERYSVSEIQVQLAAANDYGASITNPNIRIVIVTKDEDVKRLAQLYAAPPLQPYPTEVFESVAEARNWIQSRLPLDLPKRNRG